MPAELDAAEKLLGRKAPWDDEFRLRLLTQYRILEQQNVDLARRVGRMIAAGLALVPRKPSRKSAPIEPDEFLRIWNGAESPTHAAEQMGLTIGAAKMRARKYRVAGKHVKSWI